MKSEIISKINIAICTFEKEFQFKGSNDCFGLAMMALNSGPYFENHTFVFQALLRASNMFDKYELVTKNEVFDIKDPDIRQAYFDVIVSELKLAKTFVEKCLIE